VIEIAALRGPPPKTGADGLRAALAEGRRRAGEDRHAHPALRRIRTWEWDAAAQHLDRLAAALAPLCALGNGQTTLAALAAAHAEALAAVADDGLDCDAVLAVLDAITAAEGSDMPIALAEYPALITRLLAAETARRPASAEARVVILGTLESRLLAFDRVVLGGLVEGIWPPAAHNDPWLSRPMRKELGLPPPEWRIGLSAHDFQEMLGNCDVVLTWSAKADGAPTVPARWLQRLAVVGGRAWVDALARGEAAIALARGLDAVEAVTPLGEPVPAPPLALRPNRLSVTAIETLIRDPYAIYARHILHLEPLEPVAAPPDAGDRGEIMHAAFARFVAEGIDPLAPDAGARLIAIGEAEFAPLRDRPEILAFWWPRFCRAATWFLGWSRGRAAEVATSIVEQSGRFAWTTVAGREFALTARADRFDQLADGTLAVIDYKTGRAATVKEVAAGIAPQLPLEAAMAMAGGFPGVPPADVSDLIYVRLSGGREPGCAVPVADGRAGPLAAEALAGARELIDRYEDEAFPYRSLRHPLFRYRDGGPYEHLARFQEWARTSEEEDEP
ncbi:MAG TPA: double-strand break repair protein AddB, partial [Hyphomicrobiales bacterium]|nr:double-strand break repair protein AddB [Hyphomicrobiales bacterium]